MATIAIADNGDHLIPLELLPGLRSFELGASMAGTGAGATVQLWGKIGGVKTNIDAAQTITPSLGKAWPNKYSANKYKGVTVTGLTPGDVITLEFN